MLAGQPVFWVEFLLLDFLDYQTETQKTTHYDHKQASKFINIICFFFKKVKYAFILFNKIEGNLISFH